MADRQDHGRVMIVEDEWLIAEMIAEDSRAAGYEVAGPVPSVARAVRILDEENAVDAALLDVNLGRDSSFRLAEMLLERDIPFAFLTGYVRQQLPPHLEDAEMLSKPVNPRVLRRTLDSLLDAA